MGRAVAGHPGPVITANRHGVRSELTEEPVSARTGLFRGAIAIAVSGVPIFNALNNRGDDAFLVGELATNKIARLALPSMVAETGAMRGSS